MIGKVKFSSSVLYIRQSKPKYQMDKCTKTNKQINDNRKVLLLNDQLESNYLIVDANRLVIKRVNKKEFSENKNPVLKWRNFSIKLSVGNREQIK